jgi:hypothetical protein
MRPLQKKVCHRRGTAFAEEDSLSRHSDAVFVFRVLCTLGVFAVRFCSVLYPPAWIVHVPADRKPCPEALRAVAGVEMAKQGMRRLLMNNDAGDTQSSVTEELTDDGVSARRKALSAILLLVLLLLILLLFAAAVERTDIINFTFARLAPLT